MNLNTSQRRAEAVDELLGALRQAQQLADPFDHIRMVIGEAIFRTEILLPAED